MESALSSTSTNANHPLIFLLFCTDCKSLWKLSFHPILEHSQSTIPSTPYCLPSSFNGSLAIPLFQVTFQTTKYPKKPPPLQQTQFFLLFYLVLFKLLSKQFMTLSQYANKLFQYTNIEGFPVMQSRATTEKMTFSLTVDDPAITLLSGNNSTDLIHHKI